MLAAAASAFGRRAAAAGCHQAMAARASAVPAFSAATRSLATAQPESHPYLTGRASYMAGFSFPAPRRLDQIIKYALLQRESTDEIKRIWGEFHASRTDAMGSYMTKTQYDEFLQLTRKNPVFIHPVFKGEGKFFMVISQFQDNHCLFTYLEDYKKNPQTAEPYMALSYFTDFSESKDVVLIRADFSGHLNKGEASMLLRMMNHFYMVEKNFVHNFNHSPSEFDFNRYMDAYPKAQ